MRSMQRTELHTRNVQATLAAMLLTLPTRKVGQERRSPEIGGQTSQAQSLNSHAVKPEKHMTLAERYELYLDLADDGNGNDITTGRPLKTFNEWLNS